METSIMNKEMLIECINGMKNNEIALFSNIIQGQVSGATKKKLKSFSIGFTNDCFKDPETIGDLINSKLFGLIIMDKKLMNQKILNEFEKWQKNQNKEKSIRKSKPASRGGKK